MRGHFLPQHAVQPFRRAAPEPIGQIPDLVPVHPDRQRQNPNAHRQPRPRPQPASSNREPRKPTPGEGGTAHIDEYI